YYPRSLLHARAVSSVSGRMRVPPELGLRNESNTNDAEHACAHKNDSLLPPEEIENYPATLNESQILDVYTQRFVNGSGAEVAAALDRLYEQTQVDEIMLVTMGSSRAVHVRTLELIAQHYQAGVPVTS